MKVSFLETPRELINRNLLIRKLRSSSSLRTCQRRYMCKFILVETPREFINANLLIRKLRSSSSLRTRQRRYMPSSGKPPLEDRVCLPNLNEQGHNIQVKFNSFFQVKASIGFHILSVVVSTIGAAVSSVYWQMYKEADACETITKGDCVCFKDTCKHSFVV